MNKTESVARRILGWKLNRWDRWYDYEKGEFIVNFQPEQNMDHAMLIVERLEKLGFAFKKNGDGEVYFNEIGAKGKNLPQAITNAAYSIVEQHSIPTSSSLWRPLC